VVNKHQVDTGFVFIRVVCDIISDDVFLSNGGFPIGNSFEKLARGERSLPTQSDTQLFQLPIAVIDEDIELGDALLRSFGHHTSLLNRFRMRRLNVVTLDFLRVS
jgi:hypothetical protein